jgi:hypothetical protein
MGRIKPSARRMFVHGIAFQRAAGFIYAKITVSRGHPLDGTTIGLRTPFQVNSAFASEVLYKCLILISTQRHAHGEHDLLKLHKMLPRHVRAQVVKHYRGDLGNDPGGRYLPLGKRIIDRYDLLKELRRSGKSFIKYRYHYEWRKNMYFGIGGLPNALVGAILENRPSFRKYAAPYK